MPNPVSAIGTAIGKVFDFFKVRTEKREEAFLLDTAGRMRKAVEAGEKYILRSKSLGRKSDGKLDKYEKEFFKYNN